MGWPTDCDAIVIPARGAAALPPWDKALVQLWDQLPDVVRWAYEPQMGAASGSAPAWPETLLGHRWKAVVVLPLERNDSVEDLLATANGFPLHRVAILGEIPEHMLVQLDGRFEVLLYPPGV